MNVVQRQAEQNPVLGGPPPGANQSCYLGRRCSRGWSPRPWAAGGAAGVQDHGAPLAIDLGQRCSGFGTAQTLRHSAAGAVRVPPQSAQALASPAASVTSAAACVSSMKYSSSAVGEPSGSGTAMPPARQIPHCTATHGNPGATRKSTRCSFRSSKAVQQRRCDPGRGIEQTLVGERCPRDRG